MSVVVAVVGVALAAVRLVVVLLALIPPLDPLERHLHLAESLLALHEATRDAVAYLSLRPMH